MINNSLKHAIIEEDGEEDGKGKKEKVRKRMGDRGGGGMLGSERRKINKDRHS